jgi:predicted nuclease of predicted toxin-antitoxin system
MKVLLDECLPVDFRHHLAGHEVHTAEWAELKGLKNGELLDRAEQAGYQVLITVDQGVPRQQNFTQRRIAVLIVRSRTNQLEDLVPMTAAILAALRETRPGSAVIVS